MRIRRSLVAALFALVAASATAAGPKVRADYDHSTNFSGYKTFGFMSPLGSEVEGYPAEITQFVKDAARHEMESRGYRYADVNQDLLVNFSVKLAKTAKTDEVMKQQVGYYGYRKGQKVPVYKTWSSYPYAQAEKEYVEGTINVELIDARKSQLVWEGVAIGEVKDAGKAVSDSKPGIDRAVSEIFTKYSFRAGS